MEAAGIYVLSIEGGLTVEPDPEHLSRALRRAVMARVQELLGDRPLPVFFCGHRPDGGPAGPGDGGHVAFLCDLTRARLLVVAPDALDHRKPLPQEIRHRRLLGEALQGMRELRAGRTGRLVLRPSFVELDHDPLTAPARVWESLTPYLVNRHAHRGDAAEALADDLRRECRRRGLPSPSGLLVLEVRGVPGRGLTGRVRLSFPSAVRGPLVLGKSRHLGGGIFWALEGLGPAGTQEP